MVDPINVLAFVRQFYYREISSSSLKHLKQFIYAAPVYSSTESCPETIPRWPTWNSQNSELFIPFFLLFSACLAANTRNDTVKTAINREEFSQGWFFCGLCWTSSNDLCTCTATILDTIFIEHVCHLCNHVISNCGSNSDTHLLAQDKYSLRKFTQQWYTSWHKINIYFISSLLDPYVRK